MGRVGAHFNKKPSSSVLGSFKLSWLMRNACEISCLRCAGTAVGIFMIKIVKLRCLGEERGLSRGEEGAAHTGASQPCTGQHKGKVAKYWYIHLSTQ